MVCKYISVDPLQKHYHTPGEKLLDETSVSHFVLFFTQRREGCWQHGNILYLVFGIPCELVVGN